MARKIIFAASAFSLLLVGTGVKAWADEPKSDSPTKTGVVHLLGKTFCSADAPADVQCDWRARDGSAPQRTASKRFRLLGVNVCLGDASPDSFCDLRLPAPPADSQQRARL